jgi:superfamily II DNA or RNA helicase
MAVVTAQIDSRIHVDPRELEPELVDQIKGFLTIPNGAKEKALAIGDRSAETMDDEIILWGMRDGRLSMPRGFAKTLRHGLELAGHEVRWDDRTVAPALPLSYSMAIRFPELRENQAPAATAIMTHRQGIPTAATGDGKTVVTLDCWRRSGTTGLVIVEKVGLLEQWRAEAEKHFGVEAGVIGAGAWEEAPLTVAMAQTLVSRLDELTHDQWFHRWGFSAFDESHHAIARTYRSLVERVVSRYLIGPTATPLEGQWEKPILEALFGPIIHASRPSRKVVPTIEVVKTKYKWVPNAREAKLVDSRAIFRHIKTSMINDDERVRLICRKIIEQPRDSTQLVIGNELQYLKRIHEGLQQFGYNDLILMMDGSTKKAEREEIRRRLDEGSCVLISTVAKEGFDAPRIDRIHLVWPIRKRLTIIQWVGRGLREHPRKNDVVVLDYADLEQATYRSQFYARKQVYAEMRWPVVMV